MAGNTQQIDLVFLHVDGYLANRLHRIAVEDDPFAAAKFRDLIDWVDIAGFIIGPHDRHYSGFIIYLAFKLLKVKPAFRVYTYLDKKVSAVFHFTADRENGWVFDTGCYDLS